MKKFVIATALTMASGVCLAAAHSMAPMVEAQDQFVSNGVVSARMVKADANGWLVVHRTDASMKPGPVVGYAPLRKGANIDVAAILQERVMSGDMLMLMIHAEAGGNADGVFEYTLGAKEDGPIKIDDKLVMSVITAK